MLVKPGASGAPIVDSEGKLLGLVWAMYHDRDAVLLIPAEEVLAFVHEATRI